MLIVTGLHIDYRSKGLTSGKCLKRMQLCAEVQLKVLERTFQSIPTSALLMDKIGKMCASSYKFGLIKLAKRRQDAQALF